MRISRAIGNLRIENILVPTDDIVETYFVTDRHLFISAYMALFDGFHGDDDAWADARFQACEDKAQMNRWF